MVLHLNYDREAVTELRIPDENIISLSTPKFTKPTEDSKTILRKSIENPIGMKRLRQLVNHNSKVAIVITDITRYAMDQTVCEILLEELISAGVRTHNIFFLIALGTHRPMTEDEIEEKVGFNISKNYRVSNHNCRDNLEYLGQSDYGFPMYINKDLMTADVKISLGVVEPHLFAGYSGGVKTVCVGLAGIETIGATHSLRVLSDQSTRLGVVENNVFRNFLSEFAKRVRIDFTVNLVLDDEKNLVGAFSGDPIESFHAAVNFARRYIEVPVDQVADVVISCPGYPKSMNLYQATRAANSIVLGPKPVVKKGGLIVIPARCQDGLGDENFYRFMSEFRDFESLQKHVTTHGFSIGEHKAYVLTRILSHASIVMTNCDIDGTILERLFISKKDTVQQVVDEVLWENPKAKFSIFPLGINTIPVLKG